MISEDLKKCVDKLSNDRRHKLSVYLTKLHLENDPEFWETIRERSANTDPSRWANVDDIQ